MKVDVYNINGSSTGRSVDLSDDIFGIQPNEHVVYLAVKQYNAAQRQGTHKAKEKWEVARTTKKFKRQKGTGGARAGSLKSPLFKGGGTVFGPRPRNYDIFLNKKVKKLARYSVLSQKMANGGIKVVEDFGFDTPKTKSFLNIMNALNVGNSKTVVVLADYNENVYKAGRNLPKTEIVNVKDLNTYQILNAQNVVFVESSVSKIN